MARNYVYGFRPREYAFNVTFTRADENHAHTYTVGYNIYPVRDRVEAERKLRAAFDHLAVSHIELFAVRRHEAY